MANAIHEKWKNNWPDAYASPVAFQEYITERMYHTIRLAQFIPPLFAVNFAVYKNTRVTREQNFLIK